MGCRPLTTIGCCPNCGKQPDKLSYDKHYIFAKKVRLECDCGVCSPWRELNFPDDEPLRTARNSWSDVWPWRPKEPKPRKK